MKWSKKWTKWCRFTKLYLSKKGTTRQIDVSKDPTFLTARTIIGETALTTEAKMAEVAKSELLNPSCRPTAIASAVTVAECEDGIPPDPTSCFASHRFSLYLRTRARIPWRRAQIQPAAPDAGVGRVRREREAYHVVKTLMDWAMAKARTAAMSGQLPNTAR